MTQYVDKDVQRLLHMIAAIGRLKRAVSGVAEAEFRLDEKLQDAVSFDISTIGESAARVSADFQQRHPEIPWAKMRGMRNFLVHIVDYEQVDYGIVWSVATDTLPRLEPTIRAALAQIELPLDFKLPEV